MSKVNNFLLFLAVSCNHPCIQENLSFPRVTIDTNIFLDLSRSNIAFLLDGVDPLNFGYVRRMIYNIIRMYTLSGSYVTIMVHGSRVYRVCNFAQIRKPADIKRLTMAIPKVANGVRKTGAALSQMVS